MGGLLVAAVATLFGALVGAACARRLLDLPGAARRLRVARASVALLGAIAGGEIAVQIYDVIHQLQLNARFDRGFGGALLHELDAVNVVYALRGILFYGVLLVGLTTVVALIAQRRLGRTTA
ncbi:MAG TPA: hypothetical protein VK774_03015 [Solirubrobacteraceae bacterium]|nr:hypothetical protein [Solirubrobacteraceae bacterium]